MMSRLFVYLVFALFIGVFTDKPPHNTALCQWALQQDCSAFEAEVVCGADGVTYQNSCEFAKGSCRANGHLVAVHTGPCI